MLSIDNYQWVFEKEGEEAVFQGEGHSRHRANPGRTCSGKPPS
jgi:hypothetical protein